MIKHESLLKLIYNYELYNKTIEYLNCKKIKLLLLQKTIHTDIKINFQFFYFDHSIYIVPN